MLITCANQVGNQVKQGFGGHLSGVQQGMILRLGDEGLAGSSLCPQSVGAFRPLTSDSAPDAVSPTTAWGKADLVVVQ
ncbi:MAG: hypothetical protein V1800_00455 [Candidatus Latescibacterota bacterium]